jgi:enoyl-CoA hydratase/carnithine racemase
MEENNMSVSFEVKGSVGWITLERPEAMNALERSMVDRMTAKLVEWKGDAQVRAVVVTGTGRAFCAGADLKQVSAPAAPGEMDFLDAIVVFFDTLRAFPRPVIAAVNGLALAGGLETVMACDFVIAAQSARFWRCAFELRRVPGRRRCSTAAAQGAGQRGQVPAVHRRFAAGGRHEDLWSRQRSGG